jgi:thermitase
VKRIQLATAVLAGTLALAACADTFEPLTPAATPPPLAALGEGAEIPQFVPGEVLVRFRPGAARSEIAQQNRARPKEETRLDRLWVLEVEPGEELEVANNLSRNPNVEFAEPNHIYQVVPCATGDCTLPDDPNFGGKWDLHNTGYITDAGGNVVTQTDKKGADIAWLEAREYLESQGGVSGTAVIAIIDTGIRAAHQDLSGKVIGGRNFFPPTCILIFCFGTPVPGNWADDNGHGTHVAGIAAARGNNGLGVPGVSYMDEVQLLAVRVCGTALGICNASGIVNGIIWAVDNGAHVLNLSLGGAGSAALQNALRHAVNNNVLAICATGNDNGPVSFPAAYPECMAVGSTGWGDARASYSNFGPQIEIAAPGGDLGVAPHSYILSSWHTSNTAYGYAAGTSMATPQVAGLAGLLRAMGMTSADDIRGRIRATADDLGAPGWDNQFGDGRINVYRAITGMDPFIHMLMSARTRINASANGNVQVVFFGREAVTFSLEQVRIGTIRLAGVPLAVRPNGSPFATWSDNDGDGLMDLVLHFSVPALHEAGLLTPGARTLALTAELEDGRRLQASVPVAVH